MIWELAFFPAFLGKPNKERVVAFVASGLCDVKIVPSLRNALIVLLLCVAIGHARNSDQPKWIRISSPHFNVLTDADRDKGTQTLLRLEQMRSVIGNLLMKSKLHLSEPLDIIAVKSDEDYIQLAPVRDGRPLATTGFFLASDDRNYIVLDLADEKSWQPVCREFFHLFLNYNYPPTPAWFDEGLAEYFSSLQLGDDQGVIGADPGSYITLLKSTPWLPLPELFGVRLDTSAGKDHAAKPIFRAESWIVMHYLLSQNKMSETGTYLGLVETQGASPEQAISTAYGVTAAQMEQGVRDYLPSLVSTPLQPQKGKVAPLPAGPGGSKFTPSLGPLDIGTSIKDVPLPEARALVTEMMVRLPEHREAAMQEISTLVDGLSTENAIEHRTRAWVYIEQNKFNDAAEELQKAIELDDHDPWAHYYFARMKYRTAMESGEPFLGLANMLIDLRIVIDWNLDFAEPHNMLAMGRVEGGGVNSAVESIKIAVELSPRNETYLLNMAVVNAAAKKWDVASAMFERLKKSTDPKIAAAAKDYLEQLSDSKKYGMGLKRAATNPTAAKAAAAKNQQASDEDADDSARQNAEPAPDRRKVQFVKGKLLRVDCSQTPVAILTVLATKTMRLRTEDYHSLLLMGADQFSCDWKNIPVLVNYKPGGKADGDLVSLELRQ
jgi:tetratricopeptide (TPR) repeat protein